MTVSFSHLPASTRVPLFYAEVDASQAGTPVADVYPALIVAQRLSTGTVAAGVLTRVFGADQAATYFGRGSIAHRMVHAYRANDPTGELWVIALDDDGSGVAATGEIEITGAATADGILSIYIAGQLVSVSVADEDTATEVGDAIAAAINAATDLPVTASNTDGTVTITARNAGTPGNAIDIRLNYLGPEGGEETPAGLTVAITAMASGATDATVTAAITAIGDTPFDYIGLGLTNTATLDAFVAELGNDGRWGPLRQIYGHVWAARVDSHGNLTTLGTGRNNPHETIIGIAGTPTPPWEITAAAMGQAARALNNDPARPLQTLVLAGVKAPAIASRFTWSERNALLHDGISTLVVTATGEVAIERAISTYQLNTHGGADDAWLDVTTPYTLMRILRTLRGRILRKYSRTKLVANGTRLKPGAQAVTPNVIRSEIIATLRDLEADGLIENVDTTIENLVVERNEDNPTRLDVLFAPDLANPLTVLGVLTQFRLQY